MTKERKVLFVHDGPMMTNIGKSLFYGVHYDDQLINRYSYFGREVCFLMRSKEIGVNEANKYSLIQYKNFHFIEIPNFKSIRDYQKKTEATKIIHQALEEHDVIIVRLPSAAGVIAFNYAKKINKPVLVEFVACVFDALWNYDWRGKLLAHYKLKGYQKLMLQATHTIYVTNQFLQNRYPTIGKSIGCSDVEIAPLNEAVMNRRLEKISLNEFPLILCTVAAIDVPYKGQADVIKAISILKKEGVQFKYKIIGQGNPQRLNKIIEDNDVNDLVEIVGPLPHEKVFEYLENIDIYIQPSKQEGLPRAVIEAMSKACPCLGARTAGIPELISDEGIFEPGNIEQIVVKLRLMNTDWLAKNAKVNFETSKQYQTEALNEKRTAFYKTFLEDSNL